MRERSFGLCPQDDNGVMKISELNDKRILIVGYGASGKDAESFLRKRLPNSRIAHIDKDDQYDYLKEQNNYDIVIRSPGVKKSLITKPYTTPVNLFFETVKGFTIGVTGTKGKSTTASLIHQILLADGRQSHLVGNIGTPFLAELEKSNTDDDVWVCELSSYMLDDIEYTPDISVIVNLFPEHMDYHGTVHDYFQAKKRIVANAKAKDYLIYNPAFEELQQLAQHTKAKSVAMIDSIPHDIDMSTVKLKGKHNEENIRLAVTVARVMGVDLSVIPTSLESFEPLPHRMQFVARIGEVDYIDDAISTTPQSTIAAIEALKPIGTIFLGGTDRGYDFAELAQKIISEKIPFVVLFPETGERIRDAIESLTTTPPEFFETDSMEKAVAFAAENTPVHTVSLLSTASPSYSLWKNFEEKGSEFQKEVAKLT